VTGTWLSSFLWENTLSYLSVRFALLFWS
jgi:hypothetical protein